MNIKITIPEKEKKFTMLPAIYGEHYGYHNRVGKVVAGCGEHALWVEVDGKLIGVGIAYCSKITETELLPPNVEDEDEKRMNIVGSNGNTGDHYNAEDQK